MRTDRAVKSGKPVEVWEMWLDWRAESLEI